MGSRAEAGGGQNPHAEFIKRPLFIVPHQEAEATDVFGGKDTGTLIDFTQASSTVPKVPSIAEKKQTPQQIDAMLATARILPVVLGEETFESYLEEKGIGIPTGEGRVYAEIKYAAILSIGREKGELLDENNKPISIDTNEVEQVFRSLMPKDISQMQAVLDALDTFEDKQHHKVFVAQVYSNYKSYIETGARWCTDNQMDAEDIMQTIYTNLMTADIAVFPDDAKKQRAYLFSMITNATRMLHRSRKRATIERGHIFEQLEKTMKDSKSVEGIVVRREYLTNAALHAPLSYMQGLGYSAKDIADETGMTIPAFKAKLHRERKNYINQHGTIDIDDF